MVELNVQNLEEVCRPWDYNPDRKRSVLYESFSRRGFSCRRVAEMLGVSTFSAWKWLSGRDKIPPARLDQLNQILNVIKEWETKHGCEFRLN